MDKIIIWLRFGGWVGVSCGRGQTRTVQAGGCEGPGEASKAGRGCAAGWGLKKAGRCP